MIRYMIKAGWEGLAEVFPIGMEKVQAKARDRPQWWQQLIQKYIKTGGKHEQ